ncbi:MAG TPA: hypothetical protein VF106_27485 [Actinophytocola sp.]
MLGISTVLLLGGTGVATAEDWAPIGPYPTYADCETSEQGFQAAGHVTTGCAYRQLAYPWQSGYYFYASRVD